MQVGEARIQIEGVELHEELGWGATSVVYRGTREGSAVAVKIARGGARTARWFRREAAALARVDDPGLPTILELGEVDGLPYLLMELVRGPTLAERLQSTDTFTLDETVSLGISLATTLDAVHRRGLVHCDLKPRNIVLETDGRARLVDFGFATPLQLEPEGAGTPPYAAPEQKRGARLADARTDLYALGRVLAECVAGPVLEPTPEDAVRARAPALAPVVEALLQGAPSERYPSALALVEELGRVRDGEPPLGAAAARWEAPEPSALVGRDEELGKLRELWRSTSAGWGEAIVVEGERGAGKSRLLRELTREIVGEGGRVVAHPCREGDPRPLAALRSLLEAAAAVLARDALARAVFQGAVGDDLAAFVGVLSPELGQWVDAEPAFDTGIGAQAFSGAAADVVRAVASALGPVCLLVDDAQWLDRTSREVLERVADDVRETRALLVLATRPVGAGVPDGRAAWELPRLELEAFDARRAAALVDATLGRESDGALAEWVVRVSDGTPLGIVEVLDAMLDAGSLRPVDGVWRFDREAAERMHLPHGALALMTRRLGTLPAATRRVFEAAAVVGSAFEPGVLADALEVARDDLDFALADAQRAGLIEADADGGHRFLHDAVREALLDGLDVEARRDLHHRVARALDTRGGASPFVLAAHYASGRPGEDRDRLAHLASDAIRQLVEDHDDEAALRLYDLVASALSSDELGPLASDVAEAATRLGDSERALEHYGRAIASAATAEARARLHGRCAWVHQQVGHEEAAWSELSRAFAALGERLPAESPRALAGSAWRLVPRRTTLAGPQEAGRLGILCDLHYQNARLGEEYERPLRLLQSTVRAYRLSRRLGSTPARARSEAMVATALAIMGRRDESRRHADEGMRIARETGQLDVLAFCSQMRGMASCFLGDFDQGLARLSKTVLRHGRWMEVGELCLCGQTTHAIESVRGEPTHAVPLLRVATARARRLNAPPPAAHVAELCLRAHEAVAQGAAPALPAREDLRGFPRTAAWGPVTRRFLESDELGAEFEAHVALFAQGKQSARTAHPILFEHYVSVAYARLRQTILAPDRGAPLARLKKAMADVLASARFPLYRAHALVLEGAVRWLSGDLDKARARLAEADVLADQEKCVWARFQAERIRAHMLRDEAHRASAEQRARIALTIARDAKALSWERLICEELEISASRSSSARRSSVVTSQASHRRQLQTLLHLFEVATRQPAVEEQGRLFLDEVVSSLDAARGLLVFDAESARGAALICARQRGAAWDEPPQDVRALVDGAREAGMLRTRGSEKDDAPRAVAVPLWLRGEVVGGLYLERDGDQPAFEDEDLDVLFALSYQVSVALQLARAMGDRERLEQSLRQSQKMEAIGRLAGGIAHDFNNMLTVMVGTIQLLSLKVDEGEAGREIDMLAQVTDRASRLTNQLLAFSRQSSTQLEVFDVDVALDALAPMLRRLIGDHVRVELVLDARPGVVHLDRGLLEQAVVNLALNARDAMPAGGHLVLRSAVREGRVVVEVRDDGAGMSREVRENALEPFFTTKERGKGTGLGLAMVYGFVEQSGGQLHIDSELGRGTSVELSFPRSERRPELGAMVIGASRDRNESQSATASGEMLRTTVLVVDDDPLVLQTLALGLEPEGYRVVAAETPAKALRLAAALGGVDVVVSDVMMPEMNGPALVEALREIVPDAAVLFVSGYADADLRETIELKSRHFLRKPFHPDELCAAVREALRLKSEVTEIPSQRIPAENGT
ncbi:MAG: response regulator [Sandaracinaceae bacterium]